MARIRSIPDNALLPSSTGKFIIDSYRGQFRIRKWPRKAGKAKHPTLIATQQRFKDATHIMKFVDAKFVNQAMNIAKGKGVYPRDVLGHAILSGMADMIDEFGQVETVWKPILEEVVFQGCRVERTSNFNIAAATITSIPWQSAIIQTVPIWNIALPIGVVVSSAC